MLLLGGGRSLNTNILRQSSSSSFVLLLLLLPNAAAAEEIIQCPRVSGLDFSTTLEIEDPNVGRAWNEISGMAVSPFQVAPSGAPVVWGHNDGRDRGDYGTNFAAWDPVTGNRLVTFMLEFNNNSNPPMFNQDWEDMTIGSCGNTGKRQSVCLYLADLGDNRAGYQWNDTSRPEERPYRIYKIREPIIDDYTLNVNDLVVKYAIEKVTALTIDYLHPSSPARTQNSEAIFLDHAGWGDGGQIGDLYIIAKSRSRGRVYKIPADVWPTDLSETHREAHYSPAVVGTDYKEGEFPRFRWTSAEMSYDGTKIIMGTIYRNYIFLRCPGQSVAESITGVDACTIWENPAEATDSKNQFEAVAWYPDQSTVLNIAESRTMDPRIVKVSLDYSEETPSQYCPTVNFIVENTTSMCWTVPNRYSPVGFAPQLKPNAWCYDALVYFGSPYPTTPPSNMPTAMHTDHPTASSQPSARPITAVPSSQPSITPTTATPSSQPSTTPTTVAPTPALAATKGYFQREDDSSARSIRRMMMASMWWVLTMVVCLLYNTHVHA